MLTSRSKEPATLERGRAARGRIAGLDEVDCVRALQRAETVRRQTPLTESDPITLGGGAGNNRLLRGSSATTASPALTGRSIFRGRKAPRCTTTPDSIPSRWRTRTSSRADRILAARRGCTYSCLAEQVCELGRTRTTGHLHPLPATHRGRGLRPRCGRVLDLGSTGGPNTYPISPSPAPAPSTKDVECSPGSLAQ